MAPNPRTYPFVTDKIRIRYNLRTAKKVGLDLLAELPALADDVIE
jgi:hypothetical protein